MIDKKFLEEEYVVKNRSAKSIGKEINKSDTQVRYWIKYHNLPIKPRGGRYNTKSLIGQVFGSYTVLEQLAGKGGGAVWKCRCSCGKIKSVKGGYLKRGEIKSCGKCKPHYNWKGHGELSGWYFMTLKIGAKKRNYDFNLTIEQLWDLYLKQNRKCALSGVDIFFIRNNTNEKISKKTQTASLDRIDSSKGYTIDNIQWVHKTVNFMKQSINQKDFINWCKLIANNKGE